MSINEMQILAKNSGVSIGLGLTLAVFIFFSGMKLGSIETNINTHKRQESHEGSGQLFLPRTEAAIQFEAMKADIKEIKAIQQQILTEIIKR